MWPFKKRNKKEDKSNKKFSELSLGAFRELKKIKNKKTSLEKIEKLNRILRIFLKEKFNIKENLTMEEIRTNIKAKKIKKETKIKIMFLFTKLYGIEYEQKPFSKKEFKELEKEFRELIKEK